MKGKYRSKEYTNNKFYTLIHNKVERKNKVKFFYMYINLVYKTFTNYIINSFTYIRKGFKFQE